MHLWNLEQINKFLHSAFLIFDNVSNHNDTEIHEMGKVIDLERLPKYSPFLTPVENAISAWKAAIKQEINNAMVDFIQPPDDLRAGCTLLQFRRDMLEQIVHNIVNVITDEKCAQWYNHCFLYVPQYLQGCNNDALKFGSFKYM